MAALGSARIYDPKMLFTVEIDSFQSAAFMTCSDIAGEFGEISIREGGSLIAEKSPGLLNFDDVTLTRGVAKGDSDLYLWWNQCGDAASNAGALEPIYKRTIDIVQRDRAGDERKRWRLVDAWPKRFVAGDWDNSAEENVVETLVICYKYFTPVTI